MISFEVTEEDQRAWMQFAIDEQGRLAALRLAFSMLFVVLSGIVGFMFFELTGLLVGAALGGILALTMLPWLLRRSVPAQIDEAIASAPDGSVGPVELELTADELSYRTSAVHSKWQRRAVRRVAVRNDHAFIMFGPSNGLVVPLGDDPTGERAAWIDALNSGRSVR